MLSDADIAQSFRLRKRRYRGSPEEEAKYLESNLISFLATLLQNVMLTEVDQVMLKNRVLTILRAESGMRSAATRKKKKDSKRKSEEEAALAALQYSLTFAGDERDPDT